MPLASGGAASPPVPAGPYPEDDGSLQGPTYQFRVLSVPGDNLEPTLNEWGQQGWLPLVLPDLLQSPESSMLRVVLWRISGWCTYEEQTD